MLLSQDAIEFLHELMHHSLPEILRNTADTPHKLLLRHSLPNYISSLAPWLFLPGLSECFILILRYPMSGSPCQP